MIRVGAAALGAAAAAATTSVAPILVTLSEDFKLGRGAARLRGGCAPAAVRSRIETMLRDFDSGRATSFARSFERRGNWHPYPASISGVGFQGRPAIARFAAERIRARDGWTATDLYPPSRAVASRGETVYAAGVRVTRDGQAVGEMGTKLVVNCRSGLLHRWVGPALPLPS